jgi:hypothetical protein
VKECIVGHAGGPGNQCSPGSGWRLGFYSFFFCIALGQRCHSDAQKFHGKGRCLLDHISVFGNSGSLSILQSPFSMVSLTAVRDKENEVYSVTASC